MIPVSIQSGVDKCFRVFVRSNEAAPLNRGGLEKLTGEL